LADVSDGTNRERTVDGLRAIAMLWIIAFHVLYFLGYFMDPHDAWSFFTNPRLNLLLQGIFGLDILFVLSGFLIGGYVFRELQLGRLSLRTFFMRRIARLFPAYLFVMLVYAVAFRYNDRNLWANILCVNNYLPFAQQAMGWTWSLGVEAHFYILFPLMAFFVRDRRWFVPILVLATALSLIVRGIVVAKAGLVLPTMTSPVYDAAKFNHVFDVLYDKTHTRIGSILVGVIVAYLDVYRNARVFIANHARGAIVGLLIALLVIVGYLWVPYYAPAAQFHLGNLTAFWYVTTDDYMVSAAVAYVLLFSLSESAFGGLISRLLSWRFWYWPAELAYSAFLLNPLVILGAYALLIHPASIDVGSAALYEVTLISATYACAALLYFLIERPCRRAGRRLTALGFRSHDPTRIHHPQGT
jgi:peptidoglycan/LPS O-acetylase OafA/YrhL